MKILVLTLFKLGWHKEMFATFKYLFEVSK